MSQGVPTVANTLFVVYKYIESRFIYSGRVMYVAWYHVCVASNGLVVGLAYIYIM